MPRAEKKALTGSSAVLQSLWEDYVARSEATLGRRPTKREVSGFHFDHDEALLSRWTNASARPGWRIPVKRIAEAALVLELTRNQVTELMLARLEELEQQKKVSDAVVVALWFSEELDGAGIPTSEERRILAAFREVTEAFGTSSRPEFYDSTALRRWFSSWFTEPDGPPDDMTPAQRQQMDERIRGAQAAVRKAMDSSGSERSRLAAVAPQAAAARLRPIRLRTTTRALLRELAGTTRRTPNRKAP